MNLRLAEQEEMRRQATLYLARVVAVSLFIGLVVALVVSLSGGAQ